MAEMQRRNMSEADEVRTFDLGALKLVAMGGVTFGRSIEGGRQSFADRGKTAC